MSDEFELRTSRLILRDIRKSDREALIRGLSNLEITRWLSKVPHPYTEKDADEYFEKYQKKDLSENPRKDYAMGLINRETGELMGCVGLHSIDRFQGTCTMGYWLAQEHWRKGYMSEAANEALRFAFEDLGLRRIEIEAYTGNQASNGLIKSLGFEFEGMRRLGTRCLATGEIHDVNMYALFREDYLK